MIEIDIRVFSQEVAVLPLVQWLDCAAGRSKSVSVALPLIQRGSVWKPKQIIDLWDSLLRGMPLGCMMYSPMSDESARCGLVDRKVISATSGTIGLIDGQQRTLAMLVAWPNLEASLDRRIWVDFADSPGDENLFRFHVTTRNQPFGFQRSAPNSKLSISERQKAREKFGDGESLLENARPFHSKYPIDLKELIRLWIESNKQMEPWSEEVVAALNGMGMSHDELKGAEPKIKVMANSLSRLFCLNLPLLKVDDSLFAAGEDEVDPPLAVLFKRIGTGGSPLSDADYAYSVIKQHIPKTYSLVENLHGDHNIASLLSATDLVMTAVRLAVIDFNQKQGKEVLADRESPSKQEFHRMIKQSGFLQRSFLPLIENGNIKEAFGFFTDMIAYDRETNTNGLPPHAFPLLSRPLIQVVLRWIHEMQKSRTLADLKELLNSSRSDVLRFVMYWQLCVTDVRKASLIAFERLTALGQQAVFPGNELYCALVDRQVAVPIIAPEHILEIHSEVAFSKSDQKHLRGWTRFDVRKLTEEQQAVVALYQKWWGRGSYVHPVLLWLQRDAVDDFEGSPVAGREDDTPYDYDHICPTNHWSNWTGQGGNSDSLMQFVSKADGDSGGHWRVGNSIGNIRVWESRLNRSDGAAPPIDKLLLNDPEKRVELLQKSVIDPSQIEDWRICSGAEGKGRSWDDKRAIAFQRVVEQRAFSLYSSFFNELDFANWPGRTKTPLPVS